MTIHASGTPLTMTQIAAEFTGYNLGSKRGGGWYVDGALTNGAFSSTNLKFSDFYGKRLTDPAGASSTTIGPTATISWPVPLYRNSITFSAWAGGGGGTDNATGTTVTLPTTTLEVYRGRPYGNGVGTATGGDINESGAPGTYYNGGNSGGMAYGGGAGAAQPGTNNGYASGHTPGGGGSGYYYNDGSPYPAIGGTPGASGGGFARKTYTPDVLQYGATVPITVGHGGSSSATAGSGGDGRVTISWT